MSLSQPLGSSATDHQPHFRQIPRIPRQMALLALNKLVGLWLGSDLNLARFNFTTAVAPQGILGRHGTSYPFSGPWAGA